MATFITSRAPGSNIQIVSCETDFGWYKVTHNSVSYGPYDVQYQDIPVTLPNGEFEIFACDSNGNTSGNITYLNLNANNITSFSAVGESQITFGLELRNNQLTTFNKTGLPTSLNTLLLTSNLLTTLDISGLTGIQQLWLESNSISESNYNTILSILDSNGVQNGEFLAEGNRTSASNTNYQSLINKGWTITGLNLISTPGPKFSSKFIPPGDPTPTGWTKVGNIAVDTNGVGDSESGITSGINPDYDTTGYIIVTDTTTAGVIGRSTGAGSGTAGPGIPTYWVSSVKDETGFLDLVNNLPARDGEVPFNSSSNALSWLNSNGYWTTYT